MIPCKECLILPVCKNKRRIRCSLLQDYYFNPNKTVTWYELSKYLPKATSILNEPEVLDRCNIFNWNLINEVVKKQEKRDGIRQFDEW